MRQFAGDSVTYTPHPETIQLRHKHLADMTKVMAEFHPVASPVHPPLTGVYVYEEELCLFQEASGGLGSC